MNVLEALLTKSNPKWPEQPRKPKGPDGGEWTHGASGGSGSGGHGSGGHGSAAPKAGAAPKAEPKALRPEAPMPMKPPPLPESASQWDRKNQSLVRSAFNKALVGDYRGLKSVQNTLGPPKDILPHTSAAAKQQIMYVQHMLDHVAQHFPEAVAANKSFKYKAADKKAINQPLPAGNPDTSNLPTPNKKGGPPAGVDEKAYNTLNEYMEQDYESLNNALRRPESSLYKPETIEKTAQALEALATPLQADQTLHRGLSGRSVQSLLDGTKEFKDAGFGSTTLNEPLASEFARKDMGEAGILHIKAPKGSKVINTLRYMGDVKNSMSGLHEREVILPRNHRIRITGHTQKDGVHHFEAELVG